MATIVSTLLMLTGIFMILLILVQRGRGGGLAGAFGGMGGQSAFGTKAGDVFTKITVVVAIIWVLLAGGSILAMRDAASGKYSGGKDATSAGAGAGADTESENDSETPPLKKSEDDTDPSEGESTTESTDSTDEPAEDSDKSEDATQPDESSSEEPPSGDDKADE